MLGELMEGLALSAGMAADLALVEDQGQGVGQKPDHGEYYQSRGLVHGGPQTTRPRSPAANAGALPAKVF